MLFGPTAQILAAAAQRRQFAGVRCDTASSQAPVESDRQRWRAFTAVLFSRANRPANRG